MKAGAVKWRRVALSIVIYSLWLAVTFIGAQLFIGFVGPFLIGLIALGLQALGVSAVTPNENLIVVGLGALAYIVMLVLTIGLPRWLLKRGTSLAELGMQRSLSWLDIGLAAAGIITYFVLSAVLLGMAAELLPWFKLDQVQDTGIMAPQRGAELMLAFVLFVVVAPVAEEMLFRGYLYGKLRASGTPFWLGAIIVSALFGLAHGQWNVAVDTFALSIVMCLAREVSGALWPSILMHMMKNSIAFYFLFVNPDILQGLSS